MTNVILTLDEASRPKAPKIEGLTPEQRLRGKRLAMIHMMHLQQIAQVEQVLRQIEEGRAEAARAAETIADLHMIVSYRLYGNLCGRECRLLTFHHMSEDEQIFPVLMHGSEGLRRVIERLSKEHGVIHALLERLEDQAIALLEEPEQTNFVRLKEIFEQVTRTVRSHFGYEQVELEEAIGFYNIPM